jgi:predicted MFS family arabinose efflux permease
LIGSIVLSIVSDVFPEERRGFALGVIMTSFSMASIFGVPIGLGIARWSQSPQTPFLALALACIPIWGILFFTLPRISHSHDGGGAGYWHTLYEVVRRREHQIAFLFNALLVFQTFLIVPYLATYCVANVGILEGDLQYVYIVGGACTLVSMPLVGRIADRFGKPRVYRWVAISAILPALLMTHLPPVATWVCVATTSLYMVFSSARMVPGQAMISNAALPAWRPGFLSVSTSIQALATGLSASLAANIVREREDGRLEYFWVAGWFGASFYLLSLLLVPALKRAGTSPGAGQPPGGSTSSTGGIGQPKASENTRSNSSSLIVARRSNAMHSEKA